MPSPLKTSHQQQDGAPTSNLPTFPNLQRPEPSLLTSTGAAGAGNATPSEDGSSTPPSGEQLRKPKSVRHLESYKGYNRPAARPSSKEYGGYQPCQYLSCLPPLGEDTNANFRIARAWASTALPTLKGICRRCIAPRSYFLA